MTKNNYSQKFNHSAGEPVAVPLVLLGQKTDGSHLYHNFKQNPTLLIAGGSSSGKSNLLQSFICSLIERRRSDGLKLFLVDLKKVEFIFYKQLPHLLLPVATSNKEALKGFAALETEIKQRIKTKIKEPFIFVAIDEFSDLSENNRELFEKFVEKISDFGSKIGVGLAISTSVLSKDVITEKINQAVTSRACFKTASDIDSIFIIKRKGCCELEGNCDGLYLRHTNLEPICFKSAFISDDQIENYVSQSLLLDNYNIQTTS